MKIQSEIEKKISTSLKATFFEVVNESHMHSVPPNSETHFKVVIVSDDFIDKRSVARHQLVYKMLAEEMAGDVHALALHTYTQDEWLARNTNVPDSPNCLGGSKKS